MAELVDTHCHIHSADYQLDADTVISDARSSGINTVICVGTDAADSARAIDFVNGRKNCFASIGLHPHDAKLSHEQLEKLEDLVSHPKVVAVGECGLDYFYSHSSKKDQLQALDFQMKLAIAHKKPMIFHVREAFDDFWTIFDAHPGLKGIIHSFTAGKKELAQILERRLYVGLNGIMTFSSNPDQLAAARAVPLDHLVLETDAPFLTPKPFRGKINQPKHVELVAKFLAELRGEELEVLAATTTQNAKKVLGVS